jgi:hypothetical protein
MKISVMIFKDHKLSLQQIFQLIPADLLSKLALSTKVNYCAKVLQGERMFYLLLYPSYRAPATARILSRG